LPFALRAIQWYVQLAPPQAARAPLTRSSLPTVNPFASTDCTRFGIRPVDGDAQGATSSGIPARSLETSPTIVDVRMTAEEHVSSVALVKSTLTITMSGRKPRPVTARGSVPSPT
jgi:hypothetical protein